ncbi:MAG: metallophosphoesterase [Bacteroidetes bacterium]|nr:metallophosphoesterase [Bacteroidota bacterium]
MFFVASYFVDKTAAPKIFRVYVMGLIFMIFISKMIGSLFIFAHDIKSLVLFVKKKLYPKVIPIHPNTITRKDFLKKAGVVAAAIPFGTLFFGMVKTAYDYTIKREKLSINNLPNAFKGLKIVQISDLHVGSFLTDEPLKKAIQLIDDQKPDIIFFTGDLVNDITEEALPFMDTLKKLSAPMGVYSILGNHDYGDYFYQKDDHEGKQHNYNLMKEVHQKLGWKLLLNEHVVLEKDNERLAVLGVENWGAGGRFPKYGDLDLAKNGLLSTDIKLLLSHDPSHWEAKILPEHSDIAATFSGHTHGMQFGIEIPNFKWSPSQYLYNQWAGLYTTNQQHLYVNRGLGFIGYPGRVGILPEITVFELA